MSVPPPLPLHNPYAAPEARIEDIPDAELELADRVTRLGAAILDGLIVGVAVGVPAVLMGAAQSAAGSGEEPNPVVMGIGFTVIVGVLIALLVVNLLWLHRYGQTIAKRLLKIKVLRSDGTQCALSRIVFARWLPVTLLGMIPLVGYVVSLVDPLMIFRDDRRCLHDLIADTIVVKA